MYHKVKLNSILEIVIGIIAYINRPTNKDERRFLSYKVAVLLINTYPNIHPEVYRWVIADMGECQEKKDGMDIRENMPESKSI